jgi:hypothetical protein
MSVHVKTMALATSMLLTSMNGATGQSIDTSMPPHRRHQALTYDAASKRVVLYGGQHLVSNSDTPVLDDLWAWDGRAWTRLAASTGIGMIGHKLFADGAGGLVAAGNPRAPGRFSPPNARAVTARWDGKQWVPTVADSTPERESAAGAFDSRRKRFVLFGGLVGSRFSEDTWEFDGQRWHRAATNGPPPLLGAAMAYDEQRQTMVLFGGLDTTGHKYNDTWEWNGARWTRASSTGPSPRFGAGMAYDAARRETILFAGVDSANQKLNDTWRWDGRSWRRAETAVAPPVRSEGYMAFDAARRVVVMFGGEGAQVVPTLGDTWEWDGTRWLPKGR